MRVVVKQGDKLVADIGFEEDEAVLVGADEDCDLVVKGAKIADQQARLICEDGLWNLENLNGECPLSLNRVPLESGVSLKNGDEIQIETYLLTVYPVEEEDDAVPEEPSLGAEELAKIKKYPLPPGSAVRRHYDATRLKLDQLECLAQAGVKIAASRDIHELLENLQDILIETFSGRAAWIGLRRKPEGELDVIGGRLDSGKVFESNDLTELLTYRCIERLQHICIRKVRDQEEIGTAMAVPIAMHKKTYGMLYVDRRIKHRRFQSGDLELMGAIGAAAAARIASIFSGMAQRSAEMSSAEIALIHEIQTLLDPKSLPSIDNLQMSIYTRSGQETPGDVYDLMKHPDTDTTALLVGHVHATGGALAYSMGRLQSSFRIAMLHNDSPQAFARAMNWMIAQSTEETTIDFICLKIAPSSGLIKFARGGRVGGFIVNAQGQPRPLKHASEYRIGQATGFQYQGHTEKLDKGESLVLYSRGITTIQNEQGEKFGEGRFIELVCDGFGQTPAATLQDVGDEVAVYLENGKQSEDITVIMLTRSEV